jgi:hypothetical protein
VGLAHGLSRKSATPGMSCKPPPELVVPWRGHKTEPLPVGMAQHRVHVQAFRERSHRVEADGPALEGRIIPDHLTLAIFTDEPFSVACRLGKMGYTWSGAIAQFV